MIGRAQSSGFFRSGFAPRPASLCRRPALRHARGVLAKSALFLVLFLAVSVSSLAAAAVAQGKSVLIVAAHPDDDLLIAAGVAARALAAGDSLTVVYMTNGDYYHGVAEGLGRQAAAVKGQGVIGTSESDLIFFGYPDGSLLKLLIDYASPDDAYRTIHGQARTYGSRGLGGSDYHLYRFGASAAYNGANVLEDLRAVLAAYRPDDIYTMSELDTHPDHQATYWFVKTAVLARKAADRSYRPALHKTIVHWRDDSLWPAAMDPQSIMVEPPGLAQPGFAWSERESLVVPAPMQTADVGSNPKYLAIQEHLKGSAHLNSFVHRDEVFWTDSLASAPSDDQNVAAIAAVMASSSRISSGQLAIKAVDGVADGWPGDYSREWTASGEGVGAWIKLAWPSPMVVDRVVLHDRPNLNDEVTGATLQFSDGSSLSTGALPNEGGALSLRFDAKTITSVQFSVSSVSAPTLNVGLAEIEVYGHRANRVPIADPGAAQTVIAGTAVTLDGSASSDLDGDDLTYAWRQTAGPSVTLSDPGTATPSFTAPAAANLAFQLVVGDGRLSSSPASVTVTVPDRAPTADPGAAQTVVAGTAVTLDGSASGDLDGDDLTYAWRQTAGPSVTLSDSDGARPGFTAPAHAASLTFELVVSDRRLNSKPAGVTVTVLPGKDRNIAGRAIVLASSQNTSTGQLAIKAVDGVVSGWPRDRTKEWATRRTRAGSWLKLVWRSPMAVSRITLCDRPNLDDRVIAATLWFSDGSRLKTGSLPNNGRRLTLKFAAKTLTSIQFKVSKVSPTTVSAGLAEIEVFGHAQ
jgi:LmbE family N-acetylglucosaminyl deacetylase